MTLRISEVSDSSRHPLFVFVCMWTYLTIATECCFTAYDPLCDSIELILGALTQCVSTNPGSPVPVPVPAPSSAPAQIHVFFLRGQQEHHTAGHQDVPQWVCVIVVVLSLCENVQTHSNHGADCPREKEEDPTLPGRRITMSTTDPAVHL